MAKKEFKVGEIIMETKEVKIQVPEGYEIDKENSTFECVKFKPIKKDLTYEDVARELFINKRFFFITTCSEIGKYKGEGEIVALDGNNCTSRKQAEKLLAINKLMNVAKYLNGEWKPDWDDNKQHKFQIYINEENDVTVLGIIYSIGNVVYFKTKEAAQQAIDILGKETIRLALSTDW